MNLLVIGLIAVTAGGAMFLGYWGLVELFSGRTMSGLSAAFASIAPAVMALKLAACRNDLVDR
jgi:hypothetical protein